MIPEQTDNKNQKLIASFIVILAVVLVAVGVSMFAKKQDAPSASTTNTQKSGTSAADGTSANASTPTTSNTAYKDGTYTAEDSYTSPGGTEVISVSVTVKDGVVTDTNVEQEANNHESAEYQSAFKQGYKTYVVGKALDAIQLSHVSGSSLTSRGFNNALQQIKNQAQS